MFEKIEYAWKWQRKPIWLPARRLQHRIMWVPVYLEKMKQALVHAERSGKPFIRAVLELSRLIYEKKLNIIATLGNGPNFTYTIVSSTDTSSISLRASYSLAVFAATRLLDNALGIRWEQIIVGTVECGVSHCLLGM